MGVCEFHWILTGMLAGSGKPGLFHDFAEDMAFLKKERIGLIVTLTEDPLEQDSEVFGIRSLHFPIVDMETPSMEKAQELAAMIVKEARQGCPVLVHCHAGLGRTGTILACCIIAQGHSADFSIKQLRKICKYYIQTEGQEKFVREFGQLMQDAALSH